MCTPKYVLKTSMNRQVLFTLLTMHNKYLRKKADLKILPKGSSIKYVRKIFQKTNISNPLICTRQGVRNIRFTKRVLTTKDIYCHDSNVN